MEPASQRVLDDFPTPVAYTYALIFDRDRDASVRRWALCFTEYQLLRLFTLPLVSQYLRADLTGFDLDRDEAAKNAVRALNTAIAGIRAPFFSDWIGLAETLRRRLPALKLQPVVPGFEKAIDALKDRQAYSFTLPGETELNPLRAILALRNATAHGAVPDEAAAARHLDVYLPVLHRVLNAFDPLADCRLLVLEEGPADSLESGRAVVRELRGARPGPAAGRDLSEAEVDAFNDSSAVFLIPDGRVEPLFPLLHPQPEGREALDDRETIYLYDGHFGRRVAMKGTTVSPSYVTYLGVHHRALDPSSVARMRELLDRRKVDFDLPKEKVAPWTIAETAADYSRHITLAEMLGTKYLPECYVPFPDLERHFDAFLKAPSPRNGLVLTGSAGCGKSAFFAQRVAQLMEPPRDPGVDQDPDPRANPNVVFFLRGNGIALREDGVSLYRDVAEKLGVASTPGKGIASFGELLDHLNRQWKNDRVAGRRLILVIDGLNEAPNPRDVLDQAVGMIVAAGRFPWCKIAVSTRREWLGVWTEKTTAQQASPLEPARRFLFYDETRDRPGQPSEPVVTVESFTAGQAAEVYARYQAGARAGGDYPVRARFTPWGELSEPTRSILTVNPLHLHLFMETFNGRATGGVATVPALYRSYVETARSERLGLTTAIEAVTGHLLADLSRPSADLNDDDVNAIRETWARSLTVEERERRLHPVEALAHEGWVVKRKGEEGSGYRFVFQAVAEYLVYLALVRAKPTAEDDHTYWTRRAAPDRVFPEYAGAFGFLLRDWAVDDRLGMAARIVETSPRWFGEVLVDFLREQAQIGHTPGQASPGARAAAAALARHGGQNTAQALHRAGFEIMFTHLAAEAFAFFEASLSIHEALWKANPNIVTIGDGLSTALNNLGLLLSADGRVAPAEAAYRRSVEIREALWKANPNNVRIGDGLGAALNNLGNLLIADGRVAPAESAYRRSVEICEALWKANPNNVRIGDGLGLALNNLGNLLIADGRVVPAEAAYRRSVEIYEALWKANPNNVRIGGSLGGALNNLGLLLSDDGRVAPAEAAYRRSVEIREALWKANPNNVTIGAGLGSALNNLGNLLRADGRVAPAEAAYRRSVEIYETLWMANPNNVTIGAGLGRAMNNLGILLRADGRVAPAESAYRCSVEIYEVLWMANPNNVAIGDGLGGALNNLGTLLCADGRVAPAESACRRSVEIREALWKANPNNVAIGEGLGHALNSLGNLLSADGRVAPAGSAYRRSVEISEALWKASPNIVTIGDGLSSALNNLGLLLRADGRVAPAESAYRRSVEIREALWKANPNNVTIGDGLGLALNNLGLLLRADGRVAPAESAYRRSVEIREALWKANPNNVTIGDGLGRALNSLGTLLCADGRVAPAESAYRRSVEISEALWKANPNNVTIGDGLGRALNSLGILLSDDGRVAPAESAYRRSVEISEALWKVNPNNVTIGHGLGSALNNLGNLPCADGRGAPAESANRRSVEIYEALWKANRGNVEITAAYAGSLCSVGRWDEAERLVDEVLDVVPRYPFANHVKRYIVANRPRPAADP